MAINQDLEERSHGKELWNIVRRKTPSEGIEGIRRHIPTLDKRRQIRRHLRDGAEHALASR